MLDSGERADALPSFLALGALAVLGQAGVRIEAFARAALEADCGPSGLPQECQGMWSLGLDSGARGAWVWIRGHVEPGCGLGGTGSLGLDLEAPKWCRRSQPGWPKPLLPLGTPGDPWGPCLLRSTLAPASRALSSPQKKSRDETHGEGSGVEILENRPYTDGPGGSGQYTHKVYHVGMHIPSWFRSILPKAALRVVEESWNAYPYTRTR